MSHDYSSNSRLSMLQAAWVIARRDFIAVLFSRAFLFFLIGPLFPVFIGGVAGSIGKSVSEQTITTEIGVAMSAQDTAAMIAAADTLGEQMGGTLPPFSEVDAARGNPNFDAVAYMDARQGNYVAIVTGTLAAPEVVGTERQVERWSGRIELLAATALQSTPTSFPEAGSQIVAASAASERTSRVRTAQAAQMVLFLLTILLGGMVLSNLAEEKGNKIIEVLAAALPMDAVFMGKLFAMLAVSFVGISVWFIFGFAFWSVAEDAIVTVTQTDFRSLPGPAVGWPAFIALGIAYFSTAYLLLGSLFLTIGAMASSVREVQTMSMPVTMLQIMVFFLSAANIGKTGTALEITSVLFPLSSPFAMTARAALEPTLWTHAAALAWQAMWVVLLVKGGSMLFRKRVMKSGSAGSGKRKRGLFARGKSEEQTLEPAE